MTETPLAAVAMHEAGHAVAAVRCGSPVRYVTLAPRGHAEGRVKMRQRKSGAECRHIMTYAAAGPIVDDILSGCRNRPEIAERHAPSDLWEVRDCARLIRAALRRGSPTGMDLPKRATVRKISEAAWVEAHRIVTEEWGAVMAVADALLSSSRALVGSEVRRLIDTAGRVEPPSHAHMARDFWPSWFMRGWWTHEALLPARPVPAAP